MNIKTIKNKWVIEFSKKDILDIQKNIKDDQIYSRDGIGNVFATCYDNDWGVYLWPIIRKKRQLTFEDFNILRTYFTKRNQEQLDILTDNLLLYAPVTYKTLKILKILSCIKLLPILDGIESTKEEGDPDANY